MEIWGAQAVLEMEPTVEDLRQVVFPHPTVSEVIREAAWGRQFPNEQLHVRKSRTMTQSLIIDPNEVRRPGYVKFPRGPCPVHLRP